jgi:outer membrane protein assembly factor BamA
LREYPSENFFGIGPDSSHDDETSFLLRTSRVGGGAGFRILPLTTVGGTVDYLTPRVGRGRSGTPTEDRFPAEDVPGLTGRADFLRAGFFAEFDYRQPRNPRQGGYYRFERTHYHDRTTGAFTFNRTDVDLRQYLGFLAGRRVIALHGLLSTTDAPDGSEVPFYFMPWLGGNDTLRGFRNYRFRGPHSLLLQAEYRWEIWSALEGALFYDTGKVALERGDLNLKGLQHAVGFGFRFNTDNAVVLRLDAAFGSGDGKRLHMNIGGAF